MVNFHCGDYTGRFTGADELNDRNIFFENRGCAINLAELFHHDTDLSVSSAGEFKAGEQSDGTLFPLERKRFNFFIQQTPDFALHIMRVIAGRLRRIDACL